LTEHSHRRPLGPAGPGPSWWAGRGWLAAVLPRGRWPADPRQDADAACVPAPGRL